MVLRVAVYGKGGIGKSTTTANVSYELSQRNYKVIQIGCDPKHDSTRLLLDGKMQQTVLDSTLNNEISLNDVLVHSRSGVMCLETGGPEPGIGCAGRGILSSLDILQKIGIDSIQADIKIYDVLGDVVCGGFAVPMRPDHSDLIYIVTSGEIMSLYAANNILRGLKNFQSDIPRVAGLVYNKKGLKNEDALVERFSDAVNLPIVARIPRCSEFTEAEHAYKTIMEAFPDSDAAESIRTLASDILSHLCGSPCCFAEPLDENQFEALVRGELLPKPEQSKTLVCRTAAKEEIFTCAARGAALEASKVSDLRILIHGPASCAHSISHAKNNHSLREKHYNPQLDAALHNNIFHTSMNAGDAICGGNKKLHSKLTEMCKASKGPILVLTTCMPGIIGDDVQTVINEVSEASGNEILFLKTDGMFTGNSSAGRKLVSKTLFSLIDENAVSVPGTVNIVGNTMSRFNDENNERNAARLLDIFSLKIRGKLIYNCTAEFLKSAKNAEWNLLINDFSDDQYIKKILSDKNMKILPKPLPKGVWETAEWIREMSELLNPAKDVEELISSVIEEYRLRVSEAKAALENKKVMIVCGTYYPLNWILDVLYDLNVDVCKVGFVVRDPEHVPAVDKLESIPYDLDYSTKQFNEDAEAIKPDLILGVYNMVVNSGFRYARLPVEDISFEASFNFINSLEKALKLPCRDGWKSWGENK